MKTGVLESEPLDFYEELADEYNAKLINTDAIRLELNNGVFVKDRSMSLAVKDEARRQSRDALRSGFNVVYDGFLNSQKRREKFREEVVSPLGAMAVLLTVYTPLPIVRQRIVERHATNSLSMPSDQIPDVEESLRLANRMIKSVEWPAVTEETLRLDGLRTTPELLEQVRMYVQEKEANL